MARVRRRPAPGSTDQDWLDEAADMGADRVQGYALYDAYYRGDHKVKLADRARRYLEANGVRFRENFCETVIDSFAERLELTGFVTGTDDAALSDVDAAVAAIFQRGRVDARQTEVHAGGLIHGDAFVIVDTEPSGRARFVWQQPGQVKVEYTDDRTAIRYACKVWLSDEKGPSNPSGITVQRLNVYWPDRVEKWWRLPTSAKHGWVPAQDEGDAEAGRVDWVDPQGRPYGVPVFHFKNRALGRPYGCSELENVAPQQNALNKLVVDLEASADYYGDPQRWATGISDASALQTAAGVVWTSSSAEARFGQFDPASLENLLAAIEGTLSRVARRSRTPLHLLTGGDMPSGEALNAAEAGLVAKVQNRQVTWGDVWEDAFRLALRLEVDFAAVEVAADAADPALVPLDAQWRDPKSRNEQEHLTAALIKSQLGVSKRTLIRELGYDPDREMEQAELEAEAAMERAQRAFDRGGGGDPAGGEGRGEDGDSGR